jgi:V/A-type H+-transporting ATPase subunit E
MNSKDQQRRGHEAVAYGVEELIERLRDEGVAKGRSEAERIVADAEARARWIVSQAQDEASSLVDKARSEATLLKRSADDALQVAARDMLLSLRERLTHRFAGEVRRLVGEQMQEPEFLKSLILAVAIRQSEMLGDDRDIEVLVPRRALDLDELSKDPGQLQEGELTRYVLGLTDEMLREGITLRIAAPDQDGITARVVDDEIEVEVTANAVATLLLEHLQPRFRALLEGIVRG